MKEENTKIRVALFKGLEWLEAHPSETPKYFSQLEEKVEAFWGVAYEESDNKNIFSECEDIVRRCGRLVRYLN